MYSMSNTRTSTLIFLIFVQFVVHVLTVYNIEFLSKATFFKKVLGGKENWMVEFRKEKCLNCRLFPRVFKRAADRLKGYVRGGVMFCSAFETFCQTHQKITAVPTVKFFGQYGENPKRLSGLSVTVEQIVNLAKEHLKMGADEEGWIVPPEPPDEDPERRPPLYSQLDANVVQLSEESFNEEVHEKKNSWMVQFYKESDNSSIKFASRYKRAATLMRNYINTGVLDVEEYSEVSEDEEIELIPTVKFYGGGDTNPLKLWGMNSVSEVVRQAKQHLSRFCCKMSED